MSRFAEGGVARRRGAAGVCDGRAAMSRRVAGGSGPTRSRKRPERRAAGARACPDNSHGRSRVDLWNSDRRDRAAASRCTRMCHLCPRDTAPDRMTCANTDVRGAFTIRNLVGAEYVVSAMAEHYPPVALPGFDLGSSEPKTGVDVARDARRRALHPTCGSLLGRS